MEREKLTALCLTLLAALLSLGTVRAESPEVCDSLSHRLSVELRPAYNIPSHYIMREGDVYCALSAHARYAFSFAPESHMGELYPTAYQGIGIAAYTFLNHEVMGTPMALYLLQGARIADLGTSLSVGYEWNLGISWGWHANDAMNSRCNVMINVALPLSWRISPHWELQLTPDYTHFSNGDTAFSNSGANTFGIRLGATYLFDTRRVTASARRYISPSEELRGESFGRHMTYDLVLYGSWRGDRFMDNDTFLVVHEALPIVGMHLQPTYHLNDHFGLGASLDFQVDSSLNLYDGIKDEADNTIGFSRPPLSKQTELGLTLRGEIRAPIFTIGVGLGLNLIRSGYDHSPYYTSFSLKAFFTKRTFLYIGYRFNSTQYTHNLMYGVGVRF